MPGTPLRFESRRIAAGEYEVRTDAGDFRVTKRLFEDGPNKYVWAVEGDTVTEDVDLHSMDAAFGWIRMHTALRLANTPEKSPTQQAIFDFVQNRVGTGVKVIAVTGFSLVHEEHERGFFSEDEVCEPGRTSLVIGFDGVNARRFMYGEIGDPCGYNTVEVTDEDLADVANLLNTLLGLSAEDAR